MSNQIKLHKQYGVNPTLSVCFYCGEETGEIALLGAAYDGEAPMHLCTSIAPCPKCKEKYKDCVLLIEAVQDCKNNPKPTGRWIAIKKECVTVPNNGICYIDVQTYQQITQQAKTE